MHLKSIYLHNFRAFKEASFSFGPQLNIVCGPNARGKTSLLEAIHFFIAGRSFRGAAASELIRYHQDHFYVELLFIKHSLEQLLKVSQVSGDRKFTYNSSPLASAGQLVGLLQGVVASPDDIDLVKGSPLIRRQYLDFQIAQLDPLYVHHLSRYTRAMRQRNTLLRSKQLLTIESWEYEMARSANYLTKQRAATVLALQKTLSCVHEKLTGSKEQLSLFYKTSAPMDCPETYFLQQYAKHRKREVDLGMTLYGPHKDDLLITIDGADVRSFASEGQQRTCVFGLRCAEWEHLNALSEEKPLMLVDDVALGLDDRRRQLMLDYLQQLSQVILTTTQESWALPSNANFMQF